MIYLKKFFGIIFLLIGTLIIFQTSDLNPLWYLSKDYTLWFARNIFGHWVFYVWMLVCLLAGSVVCAYGAHILESKSVK